MTPPSLLVLGTDAVLAAAPATPVQLTHACLAAGFHAVIPSSWGDELIAARVIERVRHCDAPVVQCSCPLVARRLAAHGDALSPMVFASVAPPVATAKYLRALYAPTAVRITYAGGCPSAADGSIDEWLTVDALFTLLRERGLDLATQPTEFDSVLPPDRRRFCSDPGGVPSPDALRRLPAAVELVELRDDEFAVDLAEELLTHSRALVDVAVAVGCACSGAGDGGGGAFARDRVREQEPPRALGPVVDHSLPLALETALVSLAPQGMRAPTPVPAVVHAPSTNGGSHPEPEVDEVLLVSSRRQSPPGARAVLGAMPQARAGGGRQLPRAYIARRRSSPRSVRQSAVRRELASASGAGRHRGSLWLALAVWALVASAGIAWLLSLV